MEMHEGFVQAVGGMKERKCRREAKRKDGTEVDPTEAVVRAL